MRISDLIARLKDFDPDDEVNILDLETDTLKEISDIEQDGSWVIIEVEA